MAINPVSDIMWKDILKYKPIKVTGPYKRGEYKSNKKPSSSMFLEMYADSLMQQRTGESKQNREKRLKILDYQFPGGSLLFADGKYPTWKALNQALDMGEINMTDIDKVPIEAVLRLRKDRKLKTSADPNSLQNAIKRKKAELDSADEHLSQRQRRDIEKEIIALEQQLKR
jgi:hypothetical protein